MAPRPARRLSVLLGVGVSLALLATIGLLEASIPRTVEMLQEFARVVSAEVACLGQPGWLC